MKVYEGNSGTLKMSEKIINENFIFSMMTVFLIFFSKPIVFIKGLFIKKVLFKAEK